MQNNLIINMLMSKLQQTNPQGYSQMQQWMSSGMNPNQIINQMMSSGQITPQQLQQAQATANQIQNSNNPKRF